MSAPQSLFPFILWSFESGNLIECYRTREEADAAVAELRALNPDMPPEAIGVVQERQLIPVMVRGGKAHAPSKYRVYGRYETFTEAASVVHELRRDPAIIWAYIPDEYAAMAE